MSEELSHEIHKQLHNLDVTSDGCFMESRFMLIHRDSHNINDHLGQGLVHWHSEALSTEIGLFCFNRLIRSREGAIFEPFCASSDRQEILDDLDMALTSSYVQRGLPGGVVNHEQSRKPV